MSKYSNTDLLVYLVFETELDPQVALSFSSPESTSFQGRSFFKVLLGSQNLVSILNLFFNFSLPRGSVIRILNLSEVGEAHGNCVLGELSQTTPSHLQL